MAQLDRADQVALNRCLVDAYRCARRLARLHTSEPHSAALKFIQELRKAGADDTDGE